MSRHSIRTKRHPPRVIHKTYPRPELSPEAPMPWDEDYNDEGCFFDPVAMARDLELPVRKNAYFTD